MPNGDRAVVDQGPEWSKACTVATGALVGMAVALRLTRQAWGPELVPGADVSGHLVRTEVGFEILRQGDLDGWSSRFGLGYQQFLFYGQGFTWLLGLVRLVTFGLLSTPGAMKVVAIASLVAIPPAAAFLARSLGLGARGAGVVAVLSLLPSSPFGVGADGLFGIGLLPQQVAGVLFLVVFGAIVRSLTRPGRRWIVLVALGLAALVVTHLITVAILAAFVACTVVVLAITRELDPRGLGRIALAGVVAAGLSAFWIVPFLAHRNLHGPVATWETPPFGERLADVLAGRLLFEPLVAQIVLFAFGYGLVRAGRGRPCAYVVCVVPLVVLGLSHWSAHAVPNEMTLNLANRELGLVGIMLTFPLGAALAALTRAVDPAPRSWFSYGAALAFAVWLLVRGGGAMSPTMTATTAKPEIRAAAEALRQLVPEQARFVTVRDPASELANTGVVQPDRWLAWASRRNTLNTFPLELSSVPAAAEQAEKVGQEPADQSAVGLARYGVTHAVVTSPPKTTNLGASPSFRPVWNRGAITIFEVVGPAGQPQPASQVTTASPAEGTARLVGNGHLTVDMDASRPTTATIALAWSPRWRATSKGRPVELARNSDGLVQVRLAEGRNRVQLRFESDIWHVIGVATTCLSLLAGGLVWLGSRLPVPYLPLALWRRPLDDERDPGSD